MALMGETGSQPNHPRLLQLQAAACPAGWTQIPSPHVGPTSLQQERGRELSLPFRQFRQPELRNEVGQLTLPSPPGMQPLIETRERYARIASGQRVS